MKFEVNGQEYFLAFVEDEKQWFLFSPRTEGILRIPVYIDKLKYEGVSSPAMHVAS